MPPINVTNSVLTIDAFVATRNFEFIPMASLTGVSKVRAWSGALQVNFKWQKDAFSLVIKNLSFQQLSQLEQIVYQTGSNILHTVQVTTTAVQRIYDGVTASSGIVNSDVNRIRNKVFISNFVPMPYDGNVDTYEVSMDCEES